MKAVENHNAEYTHRWPIDSEKLQNLAKDS